MLDAKGGENKGHSDKWISYHLRDFENSRIEFLFCQKLLLSLIVSIVKSWLLVGRNVDYGKRGSFWNPESNTPEMTLFMLQHVCLT